MTLPRPFKPIQSNEADMARLIWRKQNLASFRIAEQVKARHGQIIHRHVPNRIAWILLSEPFLFDAGEPQRRSPIELPQPIFDPEINDPRKFTLVIGDD